MLSRVANSIYWMSRYVERAENLARFIDVTQQVILDQPEGAVKQWEPLVHTTGDEEYFKEHYGAYSSTNVLQFLTFDDEYPNSILSSIRSARENVRTIRETISSESWEQLNSYYHFVNDAAQAQVGPPNPDFYDNIRQYSQLFSGILDATMTRGTGWHFANVGSMIERADKSSRILDVKYFTLLPNVEDVNTTVDDLLWSAVLRSVSGFEMFRKRHRMITIHRVVEFLILERKFPRAVLYCVEQACGSLEQIAGPVPNDRNPAIQLLRDLIRQLKTVTSQTIIDGGMHEFIDSLQCQLNQIGVSLRETYFAARPFEASPPLIQTQSQS